jgi:hypothetical protein
MKLFGASIVFSLAMIALQARAELVLSETPGTSDFILAREGTGTAILVEPMEELAVGRAASDLAQDISRVAGIKPELIQKRGENKTLVIIGTIGKSEAVDQLISEKKVDASGIKGEWESYVLQRVKNPFNGVAEALVIAGSDRRGSIYGIYELSEMIGVSPWHWWADVPVRKRSTLTLRGDIHKQGAPAVKYRGIFLNDEDWGLRVWSSKTFEPETGNIGSKTYEKIFELLLRLRANYIWPAMHPDTRAFNFYSTNKFLADVYGIVMGSSHCEQMLRDNVDEWKTEANGEYNYVVNRDGVLKYWEQRVRENGRFENVYTLGMRGIHDGAMPGGGTEREKAERLHHIITDQREMLARLVNTNVAQVPQIFCPYKEVLPLYRLNPDIPDDITLVWPDDNYGYVRQFSNERERKRSGGAGVYYHVSYYGAPKDYLWLCSTPPALIAEEMCKAFDYGANKVWILNVGDLKPAELDIEFFLKLGWNPRSWDGTNTYTLLEKQLARDFGALNAPELTSILAEYYRLNFQRKPEHLGIGLTNTFSTSLNGDEVQQRLGAWRALARRLDNAEKNVSAESRDAFFELVGYPVRAAVAMNERALNTTKYCATGNEQFLSAAKKAQSEVVRLTDSYNDEIAGGKWRGMISWNPRGQVDFKVPPVNTNSTEMTVKANGNRIVIEAEHAQFISGKDSAWRVIRGLGYNGEVVSVFPTTTATRSTPEHIRAESPCLKFSVQLNIAGEWKTTVRALPTFSIEAGKPQRVAIAWDDAPPKVISFPVSTSERDRQWQQNVLRNIADASSTDTVSNAGAHTLSVWMVDPGIVIDQIVADTAGASEFGYIGPAETHAP